jgi:hypothetical protein
VQLDIGGGLPEVVLGGAVVPQHLIRQVGQQAAVAAAFTATALATSVKCDST